jgi:hypothetical protein
MPLRKRSSRQGIRERENWLAPDERGRERAWAYEELLFGSFEDRVRANELADVVRELEAERTELARLHTELDAHLTRVTELDRRLEELRGGGDDGERRDLDPEPEVDLDARPTFPHPRDGGGNGMASARAYERRGRLLARCEGFDVDAPAGAVGFVEGVRFVSRIDRPDLLEVRGGRFGRQLILVPIEEVDEIRLAEQRVVLRSTPTLESDFLDELGDRLRRVLHGERAVS